MCVRAFGCRDAGDVVCDYVVGREERCLLLRNDGALLSACGRGPRPDSGCVVRGRAGIDACVSVCVWPQLLCNAHSLQHVTVRRLSYQKTTITWKRRRTRDDGLSGSRAALPVWLHTRPDSRASRRVRSGLGSARCTAVYCQAHVGAGSGDVEACLLCLLAVLLPHEHRDGRVH